MTFDKQVKEAKKKKLKYRITRDIIFVVLGIIFLAISILSAYKDNKDKSDETNAKINTTIKEND